MSDALKHECGVAMLRLRQPKDYYRRKYGTSVYGFQKLALLLEKQHNRGQDGAGIAGIRLDVKGERREGCRFKREVGGVQRHARRRFEDGERGNHVAVRI